MSICWFEEFIKSKNIRGGGGGLITVDYGERGVKIAKIFIT